MRHDWTTLYFADPHPERFVEEVRAMARRGELSNGPSVLSTVVFLGEVIAANPSIALTWFDALRDLLPDDLHTLHLAANYSGVCEARQYFSDSSSVDFNQVIPSVLSWGIDDTAVLDSLWAHYFATGHLSAVRRIISVLEFMADVSTAEWGQIAPQPDEARRRASREALLGAASGSLQSLMQQHPPLADYCGQLVLGDELSSTQRSALGMIVAKLNESPWVVASDTTTGSATIGGPSIAPPDARDSKPWWKVW
jgi:hypothetical protein